MKENEQVLKLLNKISTQLDQLENRVNKIEDRFQGELSNTLSIAVDSFDDYCGHSDEKRRDLSDKVEIVKKMTHTLSQTNTLETLELLIEKAPQLTEAIEQLESLPEMISVATDSFDELFKYAQNNGLDVSNFAGNFSLFALKLLTLFEEGNLNKLLDSGILDRKAIETVGAMGRSLSQAESRKVGPMSVLSALFNPNVQIATGFLINFAEEFGKGLNKDTNNN